MKGFLVLAVAFLSFAPPAASAASNVGATTSAAYAPCQETVVSSGKLVSEKILPIDCSAAEVSAYSQMTGTYLPGMSGGDSLGAEASAYGHMTGTYLPGMSGGDSLGAEASAYGHMTGTYLPGMSRGDSLGAQASVYGHMTGTYLPGMSGGDSLGAEASASADTQAP